MKDEMLLAHTDSNKMFVLSSAAASDITPIEQYGNWPAQATLFAQYHWYTSLEPRSSPVTQHSQRKGDAREVLRR